MWECTQELIGYRNLILECAKELWHKKHPDRERLPKGFEDGFELSSTASRMVPQRFHYVGFFQVHKAV